MQIFAYPGDRVDFISKSASAGAVEFGDPIGLIEEFFGPAHTKTDLQNKEGHQELTYYNGSLSFEFSVGKLYAITVEPALSKEKIEIFVDRERVSGPVGEAAQERTEQVGVTANYGHMLEKIRFTARNN
ncbi:MAG TPA: hypothetical protein DIS84_07040 [Corynebacterium stationis]|nr:hypothetical protein [Corynebacterium stationis]